MTAVVALAIVSIVASPMALLLLDTRDVDWNRLSSIGQSYGAVSAILSAAAVGGVVVALMLQNEQARDARHFAIREVHRELLRMAIDKPALLEAWGPLPGGTVNDPALIVYTNLVLNYLVLLHETGTASIDEIRLHIGSIVQSRWMREYWAQTVAIWRTGIEGRGRLVVEVLDEEFKRADSSVSSDRPLG
jgi:hypothetical protein